MVRWTLYERYTLYHLFHCFGYDRNDQDWWMIYTSMHGKKRPHQVVYDDWGQRDHESRGAMYRTQVFKRDGSQYTDEENVALVKALHEITRHAKELGITLPKMAKKPRTSPANQNDALERSTNDLSHADDNMPAEEPVPTPLRTSERSQATAPGSSLNIAQRAEDTTSSTRSTNNAAVRTKLSAHSQDGTSQQSKKARYAMTVSEALAEVNRPFSPFVKCKESNEAPQERREGALWQPDKTSTDGGVGDADTNVDDNAQPAEPPLFALRTVDQDVKWTYGEWVLENIEDIIFEEIVEPPATNVRRQKKRQRVNPAPTPRDRINAFFAYIFDGKIDEETIDTIIKRADNNNIEGIYRVCCYLTEPRHLLKESFDARRNSPFFNFHVAARVFGRKLHMVHYKDVTWQGKRGGQPMIGFEGMQPLINMEILDETHPDFRSGSRVYTIKIFQPNCLGMGNTIGRSTACVTFDAMICNPKACRVCSGGNQILEGNAAESSNLPRVHGRFLMSENEFYAGPTLGPNRHHEEFVEDLELGPIDVEFTDDHSEPVIICNRWKCASCIEYMSFYKKLE